MKASFIMFVHTETHTRTHIYTPINAHLHIYTNKQTNTYRDTNFPDNSSFVKHDACMCVAVIDGLFRSNRDAMGNLPYYR